MPLPKITAPTYALVLPSSKRKCRYRPFLVKEEKLLIIAMESEDTKQITDAVKTVLKNCIITRGIKVEKLSTFDMEYLFLNVRGKAVGEDVADLDSTINLFPGHISVASADYTDLVDTRLATKSNIDLMVQTAKDDSSLYMHIINRGSAVTFGETNDVKVRIGFLQGS